MNAERIRQFLSEFDATKPCQSCSEKDKTDMLLETRVLVKALAEYVLGDRP